MITKEKAIEIMSGRGYEKTAEARYNKGVDEEGNSIEHVKISFLRMLPGTNLSLHAEVDPDYERVKLSFVQLKMLCFLETATFDLHHKDFTKFEEAMIAYASMCLQKDVFEALKEFHFGKQDVQEEIKPKKKKVPVDQRKMDFWLIAAQHGKAKGYSKKVCLSFYNYWTETNDGGKDMKWEITKRKWGTFDICKRLDTWVRNEQKYDAKFKSREEKIIEKQNKVIKQTEQVNPKDLF